MARTRRSRQAADAPPVGSVAANSDTEQQQTVPSRGRTRTSRAAASKRQESIDDAATTAPSGAPHASARNTSVDSVEVGRRALETPSLRRDTTGLDLADDSIFGDLGDSFADGEVPGFEREEEPPRSASTTRSWSTFKPRSRQSSVVGRNDPPIRPSSRSGANTSALTSSFNIGAFRRRAREPSILGTARRGGPRSETSGRGAQSDLESEGEGYFAPEAESTPLHNRRRTRASLASAANVSTDTARATRKRKSEAAAEAERAAKTTRTEDTDSDSEISDLTSPLRPPSTPIHQRATTPIDLDEIHAPPASSGSEDEDIAWPDIHALAKRRRRPSATTPLRAGVGEDDEILSDISSPPSLTHSPNYEGRAGRGRAALRAAQSKPLTTADLANLLPKRKYKKTHHEEADSDGEQEEQAQDREQEEEEEQVPVTRTRGGRISRPPSRGASTPANNQQSNATSRRTRSASKHKTYGRRSSDKENNPDEEREDEDEEEGDSQFHPLADDTFGDTTTAGPPDFQSIDELKRATKKFSEVDKWQLDYEEVTESLSPQGAR
ncbi:ATP-dependent RNA helicase Mrh4 [Cordyceps javanica]|uniref:ATP-dependent RNA helicase Mrh4 n=1 Tax=Cordyceps javanica TaxID=43265 RepID=A0A545UYP8_9HYPO|nr:ATP-dependent RNA helicase Mrh4 [Cordyceps javanica]TQW06483.1 ATP-dependent RNA helicase Mrh4 [Cordyceps javanica]